MKSIYKRPEKVVYQIWLDDKVTLEKSEAGLWQPLEAV